MKRRGGKFEIVSTARVDLPNVNEIESYRPARVKELAQGIRRAVDSYRFDGSECVISVDNRLLRVRSVRQPAMPPEELNPGPFTDDYSTSNSELKAVIYG